jgi:hypothetical protein
MDAGKPLSASDAVADPARFAAARAARVAAFAERYPVFAGAEMRDAHFHAFAQNLTFAVFRRLSPALRGLDMRFVVRAHEAAERYYAAVMDDARTPRIVREAMDGIARFAELARDVGAILSEDVDALTMCDRLMAFEHRWVAFFRDSLSAPQAGQDDFIAVRVLMYATFPPPTTVSAFVFMRDFCPPTARDRLAYFSTAVDAVLGAPQEGVVGWWRTRGFYGRLTLVVTMRTPTPFAQAVLARFARGEIAGGRARVEVERGSDQSYKPLLVDVVLRREGAADSAARECAWLWFDDGQAPPEALRRWVGADRRAIVITAAEQGAWRRELGLACAEVAYADGQALESVADQLRWALRSLGLCGQTV